MLEYFWVLVRIGVMKNNKHFKDWIKLKEKLHFNARRPRIHEGEVWWCSFGEMSVSRLHNKMGELPASDLQIVKDGFLKLYG